MLLISKNKYMKLSLLMAPVCFMFREARGYFEYNPPSDREKLFWDFYAYSYLLGLIKSKPNYIEDWLDESISDVEAKLVPYLKNILLNDVVRCIQSELESALPYALSSSYFTENPEAGHFGEHPLYFVPQSGW